MSYVFKVLFLSVMDILTRTIIRQLLSLSKKDNNNYSIIIVEVRL